MRWGCKIYKEKILEKLNELSLSLARRDERENVQLIEVIRDIGNAIDPSMPCAINTWESWKRAYTELSSLRGEEGELRKLKALLNYVTALNKVDAEWFSSINLTSLVTFFFVALLTGPSVPTYLSVVALLMGRTYPAEACLFSSMAIPFAMLLYYANLYPLAFTIGFFNFLALFSTWKKKPKYEVPKERVVEVKVSEDEVLKLLKEVYGREAEEIFEFLVTQLTVEGYSREEALAEIWRRLTGSEELGRAQKGSA